MKLRQFQKADLARAALTDGLVMGWDTGLGKTFAMFLWPLLKVGYTLGTRTKDQGPMTKDSSPLGNCALGLGSLAPKAPVLLIAPGDLHANILSEAATHFRAPVTRLTSQEHLLSLVRREADGKPCLPPGFYLASYTEVCSNGIAPFPDIGPGGVRAFMAEWCLPLAFGIDWYARRGHHFSACYEALGGKASMSLPQLEQCARRAIAQVDEGYATVEMKAALRTKIHTALASVTLLHCDLPDAAFAHLPLKQQDWCLTQFVTRWLATCRDGLGQTAAEAAASQADADGASIPNSEFRIPNSEIRCLHSPAMADLAAELFAVVSLDEGVRMKGDSTLIGAGIRKLRPRYRLVLTGTPIKNRLPDVFWLITWATGLQPEGSPRWPFPATLDAKEDFGAEFMVTETNLTQAAKEKGKKARDKRFTKATPEVCQLHRLYKLLGPNLLRRRKDDIGEGIVKKVYRSVSVPMGTEQKQVYAHHLAAEYLTGPLGRQFKNPMMQLTALRQAAAAPHSENLLTQPDSREGHGRSRQFWTPKLATALSLIRDALAAGDQIVVFSAFHEATSTLSRLLDEAGVPHARLDGNVTPTRRGRLSERFKGGTTLPAAEALPVALCGIEAAAEGHNWFRASQVIRYDKSLALDKNEQSINRAHRLTSPKDVTVWDLEVEGTTDLKLTQLSKDKGDAADLVLDGRLMGERPEEVNPAALLNLAGELFHAGAKTIDEAVIAATWPDLRRDLTAAAQHWLTQCETPTVSASPPVPVPALIPKSAIENPKSNMTLQERLTRPLLTVPPPVTPGHAAGGYTITVTAGRLASPVSASPFSASAPAAPAGSPLPWLVRLRELGQGRRN